MKRRHAPSQCPAMQDTPTADRNRASAAQAIQRASEAVREFGHIGASATDVLLALDLAEGSLVRLARRLNNMAADGLLVRRQFLRAPGKPVRYWAPEFAPAVQVEAPEPVPPQPATVAQHRTGPLDDPWRTTSAVAVVDPAQCRPWARSAAAAIEGRC